MSIKVKTFTNRINSGTITSSASSQSNNTNRAATRIAKNSSDLSSQNYQYMRIDKSVEIKRKSSINPNRNNGCNKYINRKNLYY